MTLHYVCLSVSGIIQTVVDGFRRKFQDELVFDTVETRLTLATDTDRILETE